MQSIQDFWAQIIAGVGFVVWLVRLESRGKATADDLRDLEQRLADQRREDRAQHNREWEALSHRLDSLDAKIDGLPERMASILRAHG